MHKQRNFGLDLIRVLAIGLVIMSHTAILITPQANTNAIFLIKFFGALGVDVFFVLSGFLIGGIILDSIIKNAFTPKHILYFWVRRWFRTLPNYYLILLINFVVTYYILGESYTYIKYVFFAQNLWLPQPEFFSESWSLSIEEYAYVLIPLLLMLQSFKRGLTEKLFFKITLITILCLMVLKIHYHIHIANTVTNWSSSFRKVVIYRLDSIYIGFFGGYALRFFGGYIFRNRLKLLLLSLILFSTIHLIMWVCNVTPGQDSLFLNVFYLPLLSLLILMAFPFLMLLHATRPIQNIMAQISLRTYAWYLVNFSLVLLPLQTLFPVNQSSTLVYKVLLATAFIIISYSLAALLYKFYEKPIMDLRDSTYFKPLGNK